MNDFVYGVKYKINIFRRYFYWNKAGVVFLHVPKAAGTSVNYSIYGKTLGHYSALEVRRVFPGLYSRCFSFSLVRNPWDRALSAYRFARIGKTESMGVYKPEQYKVPEFDSFERFVCDWLPQQDLLKCDFIFRPQNYFVCDTEKRLIVDHLGCVERLDETLAYLEHHIGYALDVKVVNASGQKGNSYRDAYVSNEMVDVISNIYKDDVSIFGYEF